MTHRTFPRFWTHYDALPAEIRELADKNFALLKLNPRYPSLQLKPVGPYWSARVGISYRAVAIRDGDTLHWFWIGHHSEYDKLLALAR